MEPWLPALMIYAAVASYIIIGFGFKMPDLHLWERNHMSLPFRVRFYEIVIIGIILWPFSKTDNLWEKYHG